MFIIHWLPSIQQNYVNTLRPRQNGRHFADDDFKRMFMNENARISVNISLKFVPKGLVNNIPALIQIMAWRRPGDKPLSEPLMVNLLTHICVTRPQWVNTNGCICQWITNETSRVLFLKEPKVIRIAWYSHPYNFTTRHSHKLISMM